MEYGLHFEYGFTLVLLIPLVLVFVCYKWFWAPHAYYKYSLVSIFAYEGISCAPTYKKVLTTLRLSAFILLAFLIAKPELLDYSKPCILEGIDIVLVLDVSGSMQIQDFNDDPRSRLQIAKEEALRFVHKRVHDAFGVVIFGNDAVSRVPLTMDKKMVSQTLSELSIGSINPDGTVLATALITAINRLKNSTAKSKIIIALTDGAPTQNDLDPALAIEAAQKLGIKIYTIGIGSEDDNYFFHPLYGQILLQKINKPLLIKIARDTDGSFFLAHKADDMRTIYDTIDTLERSSHETPVYQKGYDIFIPLIVVILFLLLSELLLATTIWFGI